MDRDAIARNQRRRQLEEALEDERGREAALTERLEEVVGEHEGPRIDEHVFQQLDPEDVAFVREALETAPPFDEFEADGEEFVLTIGSPEPEPDDEWIDAEIARLQNEIADSRRRQLAYQRYLDALDM